MKLWINFCGNWPKTRRERKIVVVSYHGKANGHAAVIRGFRKLYGKKRIPRRGRRLVAHRVGERSRRKYSVWNGLVSVERLRKCDSIVWLAWVSSTEPWRVREPNAWVVRA